MRSIKLCILIAALCCMVPAVAQKQFGSARYTHMCSYYGENIKGDITAYEAGSSAQNVVKNIMSVIGLKANFELRAANVPNAAAVMLNSKRYILYNPEYMNKINERTGSNWAAISIFAHEIGHHLNGHTLDNVGSRPQTELDADEFSGFVLRKMGASLEDAQAVMSLIASLKGSHTHPPKKDRLTYIATGWNNAGPASVTTAIAEKATIKPEIKQYTQATSTLKRTTADQRPAIAKNTMRPASSTPKQNVQQRVVVSSKPAATRRAPVKTSAVAVRTVSPTPNQHQNMTSANIASEAHFDADPAGKYYLTKKGNLVQVEDDNVYLIASLYKSDKKGYSIMFSDRDANKVYIARGGALVDNSGAKVGYVRAR
jgi:hypothetical protein